MDLGRLEKSQETWGRLGEPNVRRSLGDRGVTETEEARGARESQGPELGGASA